MNFSHIRGLLIQELFITIRSVEVILDIFVFPAMSVIVFGFLAVFLSARGDHNLAGSLLMGMLLWQVIFIVEYSVSVGCLWNVWSKNLSNMFIAPVSLTDYVVAGVLNGVFKAILITGISSVAAIYAFNFDIYQVGILNVALYFVCLAIFALSLGLVILGLIFRFGTRIQAFAWGVLPMFQPITAAFYPVSVLPPAMQAVSWCLPPTYVFEAARASLNDHAVHWNLIGSSLAINIVYLVAAVIFFNLMFKKSKNSGEFARLEG
jgi:ABC-2 type transport system permease protein